MTIDDKSILERFKAEESRETAFNDLVSMYKERVYYHIRRMVISHEDADDLVQETFIKVWQKLDSFHGNSQLFTWIYRIATNECLNFLKRKKMRATTSMETLPYLQEKLESSPYINGTELQIELQKAILTLPEKQRMVFNMKYFDELKYREMSEVLDTSIGALKASYHHAVKKIEDYFNAD